VVTIDSIFGEDIDASAILPKAQAKAAQFATLSQEMEQEVRKSIGSCWSFSDL
jgi:hypothetical protein